MRKEVIPERTVITYEQEDYDEYLKNMTVQDIIGCLKNIKDGHLPDYNFTGEEDDFEDYKLHMAVNRAISILEKLGDLKPTDLRT